MLNPPPSNHHERTRPPTLAFTNDANPCQGFSRGFSPALNNLYNHNYNIKFTEKK